MILATIKKYAKVFISAQKVFISTHSSHIFTEKTFI